VSEGAPGGAAIRTPDQRLRVFVSSTLDELAAERQAVRNAVTRLRLVPVMFELGARPHPPRDVYQAYLAQSQVFVGIYWQSYGWLAPGEQISGLEDEYQLSAGLPRLIYVKSPAPQREPRLAELLARIRDEGGVSYRHFSDAAELRQLVADDLAVLLSERFAASPGARAGPRREGERGPRPLPAGSTSLVGREQAIGEVAALVTDPQVRLVTLTGPGGVGKTRLALAAGERLRDRFEGGGTAFVPLAAATDPGQVLAGIARAAGADLAGTSPLQALAELFWDDAWLLILDNLEQVTQVAPDLGDLLACCPGVAILATSRTVLGLRAEREYPVPPLPLPADPATASLADIAASPAVALFTDRARAVRPGFALTQANAAAVAEICRRLEGLPLAIELAAARTRLLDPAALRDRLARSLDALGAGAVDMPERQQTLRATVEWSVGLLTDAERSLLEVTAVFTDGWTVQAAAAVAGLEEGRALDLTEALAQHSLVQLDSTNDGPRCRMLETVRVFVAERLAARADAAEVRRRHAGYYRALAEQADPHLRGIDAAEWLGRLQAEAGNLAAAVDWYLGHDRAPLPHLLRVLLPYWLLGDDMLGQARAWIGQLVPAAGSLDPQARAELLWAAAVTATQAGDGAAALAASQQLEPLLAEIDDPYLHAVSQLAMSWAAAIAGDFDGALRQASVSLQELRSQDEPAWTAVAVGALGNFEKAAGRYDDAQRHLSEAHALADRFGYAFLTTYSQVRLGTLAVAQGRLDEARALLDDGLAVSLAAHSTQNMTEALAGFAQLAFADGDLERAALLAGAVEDLRQRAGLAVWPAERRQEAEVTAQIRQAMGPDRFDQAYAAGTRLNRRDAAAAARDSTPAPGAPEP
jgi:predicted ATPase